MSVQGRTSSSADAESRRRGPAKVLAATIATQSIEFYDFMIYGMAASLVFNKQFFPAINPVAGVLASFATFAVGFAARPLGAVVFGHIGDKYGRKPALLGSAVAMAVSTTLIGLLPTYSMIGAAAALFLVIFRIGQGIAVGGVWGGATLLAIEYAPARRRGLFAAIPQIGTFAGLIAGIGVFMVVTKVVAPEQFLEWAWRLPFLLTVVMFPVIFYVHRYIEDSPEFHEVEKTMAARSEERARDSSVIQVLRRPKYMLTVAFIFIPATVVFYMSSTGMIDYGVRDLGIAKPTMLAAVMLSVVGAAVSTLLSGWLSDIVGRRPVYMGGVILAGMWSFAMFPLMDTKDFGLIVLALGVAQVALGAMFGPGITLFAEMFPPKIRYSGASMGYQLANILGGGLAPFIMVLLLESTHTTASASAYVAAVCAISLIPLSLAGRLQAQSREQEPVEQAG
ncbi:MFS transporter [Saccharopolyspora tripterygii]